MKEKHIIEILDNAPFAGLTESELETIRVHVKDCSDCLRAFEATKVSALLVKERVAETIEPSPFFHTRVMAAIREQKLSAGVSAFKRFWKAANALVYSMAAVVVVLFAVTFFTFGIQDTSISEGSGAINSDEEVLLMQEDAQSDNQLTDEQVFSAIYEP